ncbi:hypothetical protein LCGC14_2243900, partial [marine sediment metagenome]
MNKKQICLLILISLLFFGTRLYKIESFPRYFNDESFYHQLSLNAKEGKIFLGDNSKWYVDIYGLKYIPHEHPPLHFLLTMPFLNEKITSIRTINVFLNFVIMLLIFIALRKLYNTNVGLLGAAIWTIYPFAIYMNRLNFPQTSLALFTLIFVIAMLYDWQMTAAIAIVPATLSQYAGVLLVIPFLIKYKWESIAALIPTALIGIGYSMWAVDRYVIQQLTPTFERFVFFWPIAIAACMIIGFAYYGRKYWMSVYQKTIEPILKIANKKIHPLFWIALYIYLIVYYIVILPLNIYSWYTYGVNVFYIGIVGMLLIKDKTLFYSFLVLQSFM